MVVFFVFFFLAKSFFLLCSYVTLDYRLFEWVFASNGQSDAMVFELIWKWLEFKLIVHNCVLFWLCLFLFYLTIIICKHYDQCCFTSSTLLHWAYNLNNTCTLRLFLYTCTFVLGLFKRSRSPHLLQDSYTVGSYLLLFFNHWSSCLR